MHAKQGPYMARKTSTSWEDSLRVLGRFEIPLSSTSYATPELLYSSLTSLLDKAIATGAATDRLRAAAASYECTELLVGEVL
ncbi:hypothetical protein B484DRAFT_398554 [Ochromonadaceae sp. CCMP2298]|nr:hypothetical protein B484DRAFT_398554 [Ochromonadaceae sp. CCMP2298]